MVQQNALTVIVPIKHQQKQFLLQMLKSVNEEITNERHYISLLNSIHFARWIYLEESTADGRLLPARLAFSSNFDGSKEIHLSELCSHLSHYLDALYHYCANYPEGNLRTVESRTAYLKKYEVVESAFYVGAPGRTVQQILQECDLRNHLRQYLNSFKVSNHSAKDIHLLLKKEVLSQQKFDWVQQPVHLPRINFLPLIIFLLVVLILLPVIIIWIILLHFFHENKDVPLGLTRSQLDDKKIQDLEEFEDLEFQNQFTQVLTMKPGFMRRVTIQFFMKFTQVLAKNFFIKGKLMGIPTIHFARWVMIDNGRRMLFLSNFDGSWQQYLGDFIDKSGWGLSAIWSNSVGFPKTKFLFTGGAYDEEHFLAWSRYYEIKTQVWYSAYPHLSIKNIITNSLIRAELLKDLDEEGAQLFLKRL